MREIVFDTETTGLDPATGHRIVEIGCVEMMSRVRTGKSLQFYLDPERDMPEEALKIHGISGEFLVGKPLFSHIAQDFLAFIADSPLVIHNAQFDMRFINFELANMGLPPLDMARAVDTVLIARQKFPGAPAKLDALCKRFNIDLSARTKHGALLDAELLADVYLELMGGRQETFLLATSAAESGIGIAAEAKIPYRVFAASEEELAAHALFIQGIKNALWLENAA